MPSNDPTREEPGFETLCAHGGEDPLRYHGAATPPIFQNSTFLFPDAESRAANYSRTPEDLEWEAGGVSHRYDYTRVTNPTTDITETKIALLEGGERARCFGSGMGAISAAILSCVQSGDHVIAPETVYGPARQFLAEYLQKFQVGVTFVDGDTVDDYARALQPNTKLLYMESPSSLLFRQQDLAGVAALAKEHGAATICDNSWASPYFQNPLRFGVDLALHSATKYLGGHSDIVAGVVVGNAERMKQLIFQEGCLLGGILDPFASWLLLRGLRTLPVRMERHQQSAKQLARALQAHPAVARVHYPGLDTDPQPELTARQLRGTSGLFSLELKEPGRAAAHRFVNRLRYFGIGCSWGGFESLAIPAALPNRAFGDHTPGSHWLVRLHIGLETADDLWCDLDNALK